MQNRLSLGCIGEIIVILVMLINIKLIILLCGTLFPTKTAFLILRNTN